MSGVTGLPAWVWELLDALDIWEEEHPKFFRMSDSPDEVTYEQTSCGRDRWYSVVPKEAWDSLEIRREAIRHMEEAR